MIYENIRQGRRRKQ